MDDRADVDHLADFQRLLEDHERAMQEKDEASRERAAEIIIESLRRHPEWKPFASRGLWNRSRR